MDTKELLNVPVKYVMSNVLHTVAKDTPLDKVNKLFESMNIHHIPVVDAAGKLEGLISKSDMHLLMDWRTRLQLKQSEKINEFMFKTNLASDLMSDKVVTVKPSTTIKRCVDIFKENYFHCLPVVDDSGKLIGLVTTYDLMIAAYYDVPIID